MNFTLSHEIIQKILLNPLENEKCHQLHDGNCNVKALEQFMMGCKGVYKMYLLVHIIPLILFKRKKIVKQPLEELRKTIIGFIKSLLFAGGYSMMVRRFICLLTNYYSYNTGIAFISGLLGGFTLLFEPTSRQSQIALYTINKSMEVLYNMGLRRKYPITLPKGECILNGIAISILCFVYFLDAETFRQNYRKILDKLLKDC